MLLFVYVDICIWLVSAFLYKLAWHWHLFNSCINDFLFYNQRLCLCRTISLAIVVDLSRPHELFLTLETLLKEVVLFLLCCAAQSEVTVYC